ncbi:MAG TPA: ABC-F family ATP-binding cassette domain-containing protein [Chthoniobacteraceae bacterium]|nr:ABC-F family ATP-binding cassette domain-containing protein [Chthoniobacteraceae bacterium]
MLTVSQISKSFGGRTLFEDASLQVNRGDRIGLVGPNGAGKTTLFSLILGEASPDEGRVSVERAATIGFLPQETAAAGDETVLELACAISPTLAKARSTIRTYEEKNPQISQISADSADASSSKNPRESVKSAVPVSEDEYHDALAKFDELGGWQLEPKAKRILAGLAFRESDFHREARALSGGWIMRAHLARLLVMEPDLLLLDEPTNHLDLESLVWFQEYLRNYPGAILMISHDREFLNQLVDSIVEIAHRRLNRYRGNWDEYVAQKAAREEQQLAAYKNQQREIAALQEFADRFRAKASKASQAQSKLKQIERMEKIEAPRANEKTVHMRMPQPPRSGSRVITLKDVHHAYKSADGAGELVVYRGLNFEAERGQRTVLVGPNGAGKSTLLKLLGGVLPVQRGAREVGYNVKVGYFSQHRMDTLNARHTVLESVLDAPNPAPEQTARTVLGSFLFRGDDVFKPVGVLSGGEKTRLALVKLLLDPPNLLLMDEPTTHLDVGSIDALIGALRQFEGTLIFISHDVHFIRAIAKTVLHIGAGQLTPFAGDYDYYLEKSRATSARAALTAEAAAHGTSGGRKTGGQALHNAQPAQAVSAPVSSAPGMREMREQKRAEAEQRKAAAKAKRDHEKRVEELERQIAALETQQQHLTAEVEKPETYEPGGRAMELNRELMAVTDDLARLTADWEALAAQRVGN